MLAGFIAISLSLHAQHKQVKTNWKTELVNYLHTNLKKADGGYGWEDQPDSHLTPTYAAIGILKNINQLPQNKEALIQFIRTHHPQRQTNKETGPSASQNRNFTLEQIEATAWLGGDLAAFKDEVSNWQSQVGNIGNYERHKYPVLNQEMMTPVCRKFLNMPMEPIKAEFQTYLKSRQRKNGSFNSAPEQEGGDGNILNTYWSVYALNVLGQKDWKSTKTIAWIKACQQPDGGFTHQPNAVLGRNEEVAYTWAGVKALKILGEKPQNIAGCLSYINTLRNSDGGFGNKPGLPSNPVATFYAIDVLKTLERLSYLDTAPLIVRPIPQKTDFTGYQVYSVQFEAHGTGSPAEAVMLADSLKINLWGAKNGNPNWIKTAQKIADDRNVPVHFFIADEPYGGNVSVPGFGTFNHILDYIAPAKIGSVPFKDSTSWQDFQKTTLSYLLNKGGGLILQISNNEPMARVILDESIQRGGYLGLSTIHFGQNFSFAQPYYHQYRHQLLFVSLQDAHGPEPWWWGEELTNHRTLFIAKNPTYEELMVALKNKWVVAVRHDSVSDYKTRMLGGTADARQFIQHKEESWKFWRGKNSSENRPWTAVTILKPTDILETAFPEKGVNIRVRCQWKGVRQAIISPLVVLQEMRLDAVVVEPEPVFKKDQKGNVTDHYYLFSIPEAKPGEHTLEVTLKLLGTNKSRKHTQKIII